MQVRLGLTPTLLVAPLSDSGSEVYRIQLSVAVSEAPGGEPLHYAFNYTYAGGSDAYDAKNLAVLDPDQPNTFHYITELTSVNVHLDARGGVEKSLVGVVEMALSPSGGSLSTLTVSVVIAVADSDAGITTMYESPSTVIDADEVALVEKRLGYRCRTRRTLQLDSRYEPLGGFDGERAEAVEGPSLGFFVEILPHGGLERLASFLQVFSPSSVGHASDIMQRMPEAEVFCRLRSRYHLTSYRERCVAFVHWYRLREMIAENGGNSWALSYIACPPDISGFDVNEDRSVVSDGCSTMKSESQADVFRVCYESTKGAGDHSWGMGMKSDFELADALLRLWSRHEFALMCRLSMLFGPEPYLFDPKARFQQVLASEIDTLLFMSQTNKSAVEYSLHKLLTSSVALESWAEATQLLMSRLAQCDPDGACVRVRDRYSFDESTDEAVGALMIRDLPSSPMSAMLSVRPDHGAAFTRQQIRAALLPIQNKPKRKYKLMLSDAYACGCPFMLQFETFLMGIAQKKGLRHRSPVLWRRAVEMPDDVGDYRVASSLSLAQSQSLAREASRSVPQESPFVVTTAPSPTVAPVVEPSPASRQPSALTNLESPSPFSPIFQTPAKSLSTNLNDNTNNTLPPTSFQSTVRTSEEFVEWSGGCRGFTEFHAIVREQSGHFPSTIIHPMEIVTARNTFAESLFRSNLVQQMRSGVSRGGQSASVRRLLIPVSGRAIVDATSLIQTHGNDALSVSVGSTRWLLAFSDPCLSTVVVSTAESHDSFEVVDWSGGCDEGPVGLLQDFSTPSVCNFADFQVTDWYFSQWLSKQISGGAASDFKTLEDRLAGEFDSNRIIPGNCQLLMEGGGTPTEKVFAVCDVIVPSAAALPTPMTRLSVAAEEIPLLLEMSSSRNVGPIREADGGILGGEVHIGGVNRGSFIALECTGANSLVVKALARCVALRHHGEFGARTKEDFEPATRDDDLVTADRMSAISEDREEACLPLDHEGVGKVGALFRSASGASEYLDDGRSEIEVVPERVYPERTRGVLKPSTSTPPAVSSTIVRVGGMDKYKKDAYTGVVPKRIITPVTSRSQSVAHSRRRSASAASTTRHLQAGDAASALKVINVSAVLGDTGNMRQAELPLTAQQERMLVRSTVMKRNFDAEYRHEVSAITLQEEPESWIDDDGYRGVSPHYSHGSRNGSLSAPNLRSGSRANLGLRMSYDANRKGHLGARDFFTPSAVKVASSRKSGGGGPLSSAAAGIFGGSSQAVSRGSADSQFQRSNGDGSALSLGEPSRMGHRSASMLMGEMGYNYIPGASEGVSGGQRGRSASHYYDPVAGSRQAERFLERSTINDFGSGREGSVGDADYFSPTARSEGRNRSLSRHGADVDEHGVPYHMYDEISRSPSVVAAANFANHGGGNAARKGLYSQPHRNHPIVDGGDSFGLEPLETSKAATVIDLLHAAGGSVGGGASREVGQRAPSASGRSHSRRPIGGASEVGTDPLGVYRSTPRSIVPKTGLPDRSRRDPLSGNYIVNTSMQHVRHASPSAPSARTARSASILGDALIAPRAHIEEGWRSFKQRHDADGALAAWTRVLTAVPFTTEGVEAEGIIAEVFEGDTAKARGLYTRALRIDPRNHAVMVRLSLIEESDGNQDSAVDLLQRAVALGSNAATERLKRFVSSERHFGGF